MSGPARRDLVWDAVLRALVMSPASIRLHDVQELVSESVSDRTVRRSMNAMLALGWLEKDTEGSHYWLPGPKARQFLRVPSSERALSDVGEPTASRREAPPVDEEVVGELLEDARDDVEQDRELQALVDEIEIPGEGILEERRQENLLDILVYLRNQGEASPADLKERFYRPTGLDYSTPRSWWKNFIYPALAELDVVETGGEGSHKWFYVGNE